MAVQLWLHQNDADSCGSGSATLILISLFNFFCNNLRFFKKQIYKAKYERLRISGI
jgi:hypothetical protein